MAAVKSKGYTLIELVVVIGLVGMLSLGIVSIFLGSMRSSRLARVEAEVKSQGDVAINQIERNLRGAVSSPVCNHDGSGVTYTVNEDGQQVNRTYSYDSTNKTMLADGVPLFGGTIVVREAQFSCSQTSSFGNGSVSVSFSLSPNDNMGIVQTFKTTVAIRST